MAGAATLPISAKFLHPIMLLLIPLWALSPLGGQAALRVVRSEGAYKPFNFTYLDILTSPSIIDGSSNRAVYGNVVLTAFNAALSSLSTSKDSSRDINGNVKIPMLEALSAYPNVDDLGWQDVTSVSDIVYSSLAGVPHLRSMDPDRSQFNLESAYMYANCSLGTETQKTRFFRTLVMSNATFPTDSMSPIVTNELHLAISMDRDHNATTHRPRNITIWSEVMHRDSGSWELTTAFCTITASYVEAQVDCEGESCKTSSIRKSKMPRPNANLTALDGIYNPNATQGATMLNADLQFFQLLINATTIDRSGTHIGRPSPFEYYFIDPDSPFSLPVDVDVPILYSVGDRLFSQRLTQLLNTMWLDSVAPYALTDNFTNPSNGDYHIAEVEGTVYSSQQILRCNSAWLAVLFVTSLVMLAAGIGTAVLDALRRGPDVLDSFVFALRDNRYVQLSMGSSMDDSADMAKRLRKEKVRFGDVRAEEDVGHVAIGSPTASEPVVRLRSGRLYA